MSGNADVTRMHAASNRRGSSGAAGPPRRCCRAPALHTCRSSCCQASAAATATTNTRMHEHAQRCQHAATSGRRLQRTRARSPGPRSSTCRMAGCQPHALACQRACCCRRRPLLLPRAAYAPRSLLCCHQTASMGTPTPLTTMPPIQAATFHWRPGHYVARQRATAGQRQRRHCHGAALATCASSSCCCCCVCVQSPAQHIAAVALTSWKFR